MIGATFILSSCGGDKNDDGKNTADAKGGVKYGGVFKMNETEFLRIIFMVVFIVLALRFLFKKRR